MTKLSPLGGVVCKDYLTAGAEHSGDAEWPDDDGTGKAGESRIDRIASSHGDGEHYACPEI